ncbi:MAG: porin [Ramlibacter sp.]
MSRNWILAATVGGSFLAAVPAQAQSSVTIYGTLDAGYQRTTDAQGRRLNRLETRHEPSYLGFRGTEDLGGGLHALFQLEGSIAVDSGNFTNFSRQSFVGLRSDTWGQVTAGRMYDAMIEIVGVDPARFNSVAAVHAGNWDRSSGTYVNNAIKYRTPTYGGFTGTLMYELKDDGNSISNTGKGVGAALTYLEGPLRVSAAYQKLNGVSHTPFNELGINNLFGKPFAATTTAIVTNDTMAGLGAYYDFPAWRVLALATVAKLDSGTATEKMKSFGAGVVANPNKNGFRPGVGVNYQSMNGSHWTTAYAILDYYLSRRTDVYMRVIHQKASGPNQRAAIFLEGPASGNKQTVYGIGMTHRF